MKIDKKTKLFLVFLFWGAIYLFIRIQKLEVDKHPLYKPLMGVILLGHIGYEGIYKKNKIQSKKKEVKKKHLNELNSEIENYKPTIKSESVPNELVYLIPLVEKWGLNNNMLREELYDKASKKEPLELKSIENKREDIENWIKVESENDTLNSSEAFDLTLKAYDDLGLWTWN